jgi:hypothetical protein
MTLSLLLKMGTLGQKGLNQARWGMMVLAGATKTQFLYGMCVSPFMAVASGRYNIYNTTTIQNGHVACQGQTFKRLLPPEN